MDISSGGTPVGVLAEPFDKSLLIKVSFIRSTESAVMGVSGRVITGPLLLTGPDVDCFLGGGL